ncbi:MAG TPA: RNA 2',3'-cyclic phosphodiesterase [Acidimicrobiia bacterium]
MTALRRAFVAVAPADPVLDVLEARVADLAAREPRLRWMPRPHWHLTLQFLGAVEDAEALSAAVAAAVAVPRFDVQLAGGGAFPSPRRATVLWVGVPRADALVALAAAVHDATRTLGYPDDGRPYHPHLTLARTPRPRPLTHLVEALGTTPIGPPWTVTDVAVIESDTRPTGAVHTVWDQHPLGP